MVISHGHLQSFILLFVSRASCSLAVRRVGFEPTVCVRQNDCCENPDQDFSFLHSALPIELHRIIKVSGIAPLQFSRGSRFALPLTEGKGHLLKQRFPDGMTLRKWKVPAMLPYISVQKNRLSFRTCRPVSFHYLLYHENPVSSFNRWYKIPDDACQSLFSQCL